MILEYSPLRKDLISPADRGFLYGDGVFETMRIYHGEVFLLEEHLKSLSHSLRVLGMKAPHSREEITGKLLRVIKASKIKDGIARLIVTRGESAFGLSTKNVTNPKVIVWAQPAQFAPQKVGLKTGLSSSVLPLNQTAVAKSLNYLVNLMAKKEAEEKGFDEMILCGSGGEVLSGTASNLFIVRRGELFTPPATFIRAGITRQAVMRLARRMKILVTEKTLSVPDILSADELFFTSSVSEIRWAQSVAAGKKVKRFTAQIAREIGIAYQGLVTGGNPRR